MSDTQIAAAAFRVRHKILNCNRCDLRKTCTAPVPYRGPVPCRIAVVGEAPGREEDLAGEPFVGASGLWLRRNLEPIVGSELFICNTVSCRPPSNRTPYIQERAACFEHLLAQLNLAQPEVVLTLGAPALNTFRPAAKISQSRGVPFYAFGFKVLPTYHPAFVLRNLNNKVLLSAILADFRTVNDILSGYWPDECFKCSKPVERYDLLGITWCNDCYTTLAAGVTK